MSKEVYLGDGLYASFDGYMFTLRAPRSNGDHWVGLEPEVLRAFDQYRELALWIERNPSAVAGDAAGEDLLDLARRIAALAPGPDK